MKTLTVVETAKKKWSGEVTEHEKFHTKEGVFKQSGEKIAQYLLSKGKGKAMSRLEFYINRAGKNLTAEDRARLNKAKQIIENHAEAGVEEASTPEFGKNWSAHVKHNDWDHHTLHYRMHDDAAAEARHEGNTAKAKLHEQWADAHKHKADKLNPNPRPSKGRIKRPSKDVASVEEAKDGHRNHANSVQRNHAEAGVEEASPQHEARLKEHPLVKQHVGENPEVKKGTFNGYGSRSSSVTTTLSKGDSTVKHHTFQGKHSVTFRSKTNGHAFGEGLHRNLSKAIEEAHRNHANSARRNAGEKASIEEAVAKKDPFHSMKTAHESLHQELKSVAGKHHVPNGREQSPSHVQSIKSSHSSLDVTAPGAKALHEHLIGHKWKAKSVSTGTRYTHPKGHQHVNIKQPNKGAHYVSMETHWEHKNHAGVEEAGVHAKDGHWSEPVTKNSHSFDTPDGLFTKSPEEIVKHLMAQGKGAAKVMDMLNFYINRAGKRLKPEARERLNKAKELVKMHEHKAGTEETSAAKLKFVKDDESGNYMADHGKVTYWVSHFSTKHPGGWHAGVCNNNTPHKLKDLGETKDRAAAEALCNKHASKHHASTEEQAMSTEEVAASPAFGKNWKGHAAVTNPKHHDAQAAKHWAEHDKLHKKMAADIHKEHGQKISKPKMSRLKSSHPLFKRAGQHSQWAYRHEDMASGLRGKHHEALKITKTYHPPKDIKASTEEQAMNIETAALQHFGKDWSTHHANKGLEHHLKHFAAHKKAIEKHWKAAQAAKNHPKSHERTPEGRGTYKPKYMHHMEMHDKHVDWANRHLAKVSSALSKHGINHLKGKTVDETI